MYFGVGLLITLFLGQGLMADQMLVLSGGGTPLNNHYSQYLQTKTLADDMRKRFPNMQPAVMFAAGNRVGQSPVLADVHRSVKTDDISYQTMNVGAIAGNTAATLANVTAFFAQPRLARMKKDETFFLMVSDHGMPYPNEDGAMENPFANNCIDLWNFRANLKTGQVTEGKNADRCLSVQNLGNLLRDKVGAGRVVFAMSQCYSGGFHMMSVKNLERYPSADARVCGFTAATEDTTASGCTPDVDGPGYQGFERSFTEQLTGLDVVTGKRLRPARTSLSEVFAEANVEDLTKDIPLSTSDFYLWKWALAIQKLNFVPRTAILNAAQARDFLRKVKIGAAQSDYGPYVTKEALFRRVQTALDLYPEYRAIYGQDLAAHIALEKDLAAKLTAAEEDLENHASALTLSVRAVLAQWHRKVSAGQSSLSPRERALETQVYGKTDADFMVLLSMSVQAITQPEMAKALSDYQAQRESYAMQFANSSPRNDLIELAGAIADLKKLTATREENFLAAMKRHGHVRRLLIYRQVLGALHAIVAMQDKTALAEFEGLVNCEEANLSP